MNETDVATAGPALYLLVGANLCILLGAALGWLGGKVASSKKVLMLEAKLVSEMDQSTLFKNQHERLKVELEVNRSEIERLVGENASLEAGNQSLTSQMESQGAIEESISTHIKAQLDNVTDNLVEIQKQQLKDTPPPDLKLNLDDILSPISSEISEFNAQIQNALASSQGERDSLKDVLHKLNEQTANLNKYTDQVDQSAAEMLKKATQIPLSTGKWSVTVLTHLLEMAGLRQDKEYHSIVPKNKKNPAADVEILLPNGKALLVDSNLDMTQWYEYMKSESESEQELSGKAFIEALHNRMDIIASSEYLSNSTTIDVDFVFLFIPVENAWFYCTHNEPSIITYGQQKNIAVVSASNLLLALKLIENIWHNEHRYINIDKIMTQGKQLYAKWQEFTGDMAQIGDALKLTSEKYNRAVRSLSAGKNNLLVQAEELIELGIEPSEEHAFSLSSKNKISEQLLIPDRYGSRNSNNSAPIASHQTNEDDPNKLVPLKKGTH
ncbi:MAG: DNA recombination protein RmuC [Gammaproteobacteria bacterium]